MTKFCVMGLDDVPDEHRSDFLNGMYKTADWARHESTDSIADEAYLAVDLTQNPLTSKATFWEAQGALTACANAMNECPHCGKSQGPCDAAGQVA
jgi:hypothetical protein